MHAIGRAAALKLAGMGADIAVTDVQKKPEETAPDETRAGWRSPKSPT